MGLGIRNFYRNFSAFSLLVCVVSLCALFATSAPAQAAAGINQQMNFQGRLLNNQGAVVPDGYYNIEFKIYQDGNGCVSSGTAPCGGTLQWTEDYTNNNTDAGVQVVNGYMSVQLGSLCALSGGYCPSNGITNNGINWDSDTLWLSMNIAGYSNTCTAFNGTGCAADGEMTPMKRLSANAYALNALSAINSQELGGVSSGNFVQFATNTLQTNSSASNSIYINNSSTGNLVDFQTSGVNSFIINNNGNVVFGYNTSHSISVAASTTTAGQALSLTAGAAGTGGSALAGGTLTLDAGAGGGTNGNGGNLVLDAGAPNGTGTAGTITVGANNASSVTLGNSVTSTQVKQTAGTATSTLTNTGGEAIVGSGSTNTTTALKVSNSSTTSLFQITDDGTVDLGVNSLNNPALIINTSGQITTATTVNATSSTALLIQSSSTGQELDVDTSANQVLIGQAGHVNGLVALESTTGGYVGLAAPSISSGNSYSLNLPTAAPTATNQCLQSSATFTQLTFAACGTTGSFINNAYGTTQSANFNIKGASATTTTAVVASDGADILDLLNSSGTPVVTFDLNGNVTNSATGTSSFGGTLTVATKVVTPTLDTASSVPLNIGATSSQINLNQNVVIANGANRTLGVATAASGSGNNLNITAGSGASGTTNGGNISIDAGAKGTTGTDGTVNIGTNHASAVNIGNSGATTTNNGNLAVNGTASVGTTANNGTLVFNSTTGSGARTITLNTAGVSNASYSLTLPSTSPAAGLCLETSPGNAQQLVFASCTNNNSSIQEVQEHDSNNATTVAFTPVTVGDEIVVTTQIPTASTSVCSISGGEVTTWNKIVAANGNGTVNRVEMWAGTVSSIGSTAISLTYGTSCPTSSSAGSNEITATEFTAAGVNASTSWGIESSGSQLNSVSSATVTYPTATSVDGSELYVGYAQVQNPPATSSSYPNFSYQPTSIQHNMIVYDTDLAANTTYTPTATQNIAGESNTIDAVLTAFVTSTSINNTTSLQKANFYVQAASSGTVAGILQAASSGTADIFEIKNSAGTANYLQVGSTGNLTLNAATSTAAVQVLNGTSGYNVFGVDTTNNQTILGASNHIAGTLTFDDTSDTNSISLQAPTSIAASYTLALPTNTPTAGLCLGTSPSNANQLIFASCATQVSAAGISYVNKWSAAAASVADSPATKGDLLILFSHTTGNATISSFSANGGASSWTKVNAYNSAGGTQGNIEMWRGVVNTTGSNTVTATYAGTTGTIDLSVEEFTMGSSSGTWAIDTSGTSFSATAVTTVNFPGLTAQNSSEMYTGYGFGLGTMSAVTTTGFTNLTTTASKDLAYDPSVVGGISYTPTATQTSGDYDAIGAMIEAYSGTSVIVSTTATQEANFNVQAATAGTVAGVLQAASSGTADIFDALDSSGNKIAAINSANGLTLGAAGAVGGQINFNSSGNTNSITIQAPLAPGASYTLSLPTTTPAAGQCLATSPSNASLLVFSSCANQVTSVAITNVNTWKVSTTGNTPTLSVSPTNIGDLMTFFVFASKSNTINSVSGGGVTTWVRIVTANSEDMWRGVVTSTGTSNITVNVSTPSGPTDEMAAQEWTTGSATGSWVIDTSATITNSTASTTVTYPSLTPQSTKDLYVGYAVGTSTMSGGTTPSYTYFSGAGADMYGTYNTAISTTTQPTANQTTSGTSFADAALIAAYSSSSVIANSDNTQEANFDVQAATSNSIAGVLQAFPTGSGDTLDLLDGTGAIVESFGNTGNALFKPSTASASALRVQTTGGVNVFDVDTNANLVNIGAGATGESSPSQLVLDNETGTSADPTITSGSNSSGAMYYNATTNAFRCSIDGAWENCNSLLYANTSASSVNNNCTNNCVAFSNSASIPANYCQAGRVIDIYANGYFSSLPTASNLQFGVYYGTNSTTASSDTLLGTLSPAATVTSASSNYFQLNYTITCFSTSSMQSGGVLNIQTGSSGSGMLALPLGASTTTTVVTSSAKNLYIFPVWDNASTSNTATLSQLTVNNY